MKGILRNSARKYVFSRIVSQRATFSSISITEKEKELTEKLKNELKASIVEVTDTSGGCGSMYSIKVISSLFEGKSRVNQHKLVHKVLEKEIKQIHGLTLVTKSS